MFVLFFPVIGALLVLVAIGVADTWDDCVRIVIHICDHDASSLLSLTCRIIRCMSTELAGSDEEIQSLHQWQIGSEMLDGRLGHLAASRSSSERTGNYKRR